MQCDRLSYFGVTEEPREADGGQELPGFDAGPQRDSARDDVQLRAVHQAQRCHAVRRV